MEISVWGPCHPGDNTLWAPSSIPLGSAFQCSPCSACRTRSPEAGLSGGMKEPVFSRSEPKFEPWLMFSIVWTVPRKSWNKQAWDNGDPSHPVWRPDLGSIWCLSKAFLYYSDNISSSYITDWAFTVGVEWIKAVWISLGKKFCLSIQCYRRQVSFL